MTNIFPPEKVKHHAEILSNRVKKLYDHMRKRFARQGIECFRLYDWDIPEVRAVVDWYAGHLVIGEYVRTQTGPDWLPQMAEAVGNILGVPKEKIHIRRRQTKTEDGPRYKKRDSTSERIQVSERNLKFWVNLDDFLDTGLFSDHRDTRVMISELAKGKDFLNLYGYTGAFTCAAAFGGAKSTVTVDRSKTYLNWAKDNLILNGFWDQRHELVQADTDKFLDEAFRLGRRFNLAFIDPPSFFQEVATGKSFDVNRAHPSLIRSVIKIMEPGSLLFFSTNHQRFEPKLESLPVKDLVEITAKTIPEDYRNKQIHRLWRMVV